MANSLAGYIALLRHRPLLQGWVGDPCYIFMIGSYKKYEIMSMTLNEFLEISIFHDFSWLNSVKSWLFMTFLENVIFHDFSYPRAPC